MDLRARMEWGQEDLAREMCKVAAKMGSDIRPNRICVLRWENGEAAPNEHHRVVLARIAARERKTEDLAQLFRAPVSAWRLAAYVHLGGGNER